MWTDVLQVLSGVGLIRLSRRGGFCPACRLVRTGDAPQEIAAPSLIAFAALIVAAMAWVVTIARSDAMADMPMGLGPVGPFLGDWALMISAMMLPSATPLLFEFARTAEGRRRWRSATALVAITYLGVWLAFGLSCYALFNGLGMPWQNQGLMTGGALVLAGVYTFSPVERACETWCRELSALHDPLPFDLMLSAVMAGFRYGVSCVGCNAALMLAMLLIGMHSLGWMIALAAVMWTRRFASVPALHWGQVLLSAALLALGLLYVVGT